MLTRLIIVLVAFIASVCWAQQIPGAEPSGESVSLNRQSEEPCGSCDRSKCLDVSGCNAGLVEDRCGCCKICGLEESHSCNLESDVPLIAYGKSDVIWHGRCGKNLECRVRTDVSSKLVGKQSICYCKLPGLFCGSDGSSYSFCQLDAQTVVSGGTVQKISDGPCKTKPSIELTAPVVPLKKGDKVTLVCEARGYPRAEITWDLKKPNDGGKSTRMPSNSEDVAVSLRGGTSETQVTSYLQITGFSLEHEGEYRCLAENELGMDAKTARIVMDT